MLPQDVVVHFECCGKEHIVEGKYDGQHAEYKLTCDVCGMSSTYGHDVNAEDQPTVDDINEEDGKVHIYLNSCTDEHCNCHEEEK